MPAIGALTMPGGARGDLRRFLLSVAPTGAAAGLQLVTFALTARALGPETFGALAVVYGVSAVATEVAGLGGDAALVREASDPRRFPRAWGHALVLLAASVPPVALAAAVAAALLTSHAFGFATLAALVSGEILVGRAAAAAELAMIAHGHAVRASLVRLATASARATAAVAVFGLLRLDSVPAWAAVTLAQSAALAGALLVAVGRIYRGPVYGIETRAVRFGLLLMLNQLARSLNGNLDRIVLSAVLAPLPLGLYASAARLQLLPGILNQAATRIYYPRFFRAAEAGAGPLRALARHAAGRMALVGLLSLGLVALAGPLLALVLGPAYRGLAGVATGLAAAAPFTALQYPAADALTAGGRQGLRTVIYLAAAAASAGLLAAGAALAGLPGAVAAFVAVQAGLAGALWLAHLLSARPA
jgi:O-antigen/teichoic acid export membrane protein